MSNKQPSKEEVATLMEFLENQQRVLQLNPYFLTLPFMYRKEKREAKMLFRQNKVLIQKMQNLSRGGKMKKLLVLMFVMVVAFATPVGAVGNQIVAETPIVYSDGRPSPSWRLPLVDDKGVTLEYGNAWDNSDIKGARDAFLYEEAGTYYLTYDGVGQNAWGVNEATSTDLVNWSNMGRVLTRSSSSTASDSAAAAYGTIYKDGANDYHMFYLGAKVKAGQPTNVPLPPYITMQAKATSPTGTWTKTGRKPIPLVPDSYREVTASPGEIIKQGDHYYMFFSAAAEHLGKYYRGIGLAWTTDLDNPTWSVGSGAIIPIYEQVENVALHYQESDETWYMFVNHVGINGSGEETTDSIWVYWSDDPFDWNTDNKAMVIDAPVTDWTDTVVGIPTVTEKDGKLSMIYDGRTPTNSSSLLNNINRDLGLAEIDLPIELP